MDARTPHVELTRNLVLIGARGCGKSAVARRIARQNRNFMFFSLDALIRYEAGGLTIPALVEREGWRGFRELEFEVVRKLAVFESGALLDCGGGVVVDLDEQGEEVYSERKVEALRRHGYVVYLRREPEYLRGRIAGDRNRPDLSETRSFVEIVRRRDPWYRAAADLVLECGRKNKDELTKRVLSSFYASQREARRREAAG